MPKTATKASDNEFYKARIAAASCNERLSSREGAAEETSIDRTRLARIELGSLNPYPEEVLLMSDTYNAPEIENYYCTHLCPLGKRTVTPAEMQDIDRLTIRVISALGDANHIKDAILQVAKDGEVSPDESDQVLAITSALEQIAITAQEMKLWVAKNLKGGSR